MLHHITFQSFLRPFTDISERFSNRCILDSSVEDGFFLRKKPLSGVVSGYSYWRTSIARGKRGKTPAEASRESGNVDAAVSSRAGDQIRDVLPPDRTVAGLEEPLVAHPDKGRVDG
jgi:hypothetical protein